MFEKMPALRPYVYARNSALACGITDNDGAIQSIERILDRMALQIKYPGFLYHTVKGKIQFQKYGIRISKKALAALQRQETIYIEHVYPKRAFAVQICNIINQGGSDAQVIQYIKDHYELAILSKAETDHLNKVNRSKYVPDRIAHIEF